MPQQTKDFTLKLKVLDDSGSFSGYASTYGGPPDLYGDIVAPGAFKQAIYSQGNGYPLLWAHDQSKPVGLEKISDSTKGLIVDGALNLESPVGQTAYSDLKFGSVKGLSIGYDCLEGKYTYDQTGIRTLNEVRLFEISLVAIPANPLAQVTSVKSLQDARRLLREAATNPDDKVALRSLLKEIRLLLDPEDDENEEDLIEDADEKEIVLALRGMVLELKGMRLSAR